MHPLLTHDRIANAFTYPRYRKLIDDLVAQGKTTGLPQKPVLVEYTTLNVVRMNRLDKTVTLSEELRHKLDTLREPLLWVVLTEAWCPDSAQCIPVMAKIEEYSPHISLRLLLRDENPDLMDSYLTNGGRSIPKLICMKADSGTELGTWGPRPAPLQEMVMQYYKDPQGVSHDDFLAKVQLWYARDKTVTLQQELQRLIRKWSAE
jgi:hypothetical protein